MVVNFRLHSAEYSREVRYIYLSASDIANWLAMTSHGSHKDILREGIDERSVDERSGGDGIHYPCVVPSSPTNKSRYVLMRTFASEVSVTFSV